MLNSNNKNMNRFYKKYLNIGFLSLFAGLVLFSCSDDETDYVSNAKPVITASTTTFTVDEGNNVTITLTSNVASSFPMQIKLDVLSDSEDDVSIPGTPVGIGEGLGVDGYLITFPANATTFTFNIGAVLDEEFEETENVKIRMSSTGTMYGAINPASEYINLTINNVASNTLNLTFDWEQNFEFGGDAYSLCDLAYDVDIIVLDEDGNDLNVADAQTGDCPEHLTMNLEDYPDGTYLLAGLLWDNAGIAGVGIPEFNIPMTISYQRGGSETLETESSFTTPFLTSESANEEFILVAIVTIENGVFTIQDADENTIAQGRQANIKNTLKNLKSKRSKLKK